MNSSIAPFVSGSRLSTANRLFTCPTPKSHFADSANPYWLESNASSPQKRKRNTPFLEESTAVSCSSSELSDCCMMRENERCSEISSAPSFSFTVVAPYPSMQYLGCVSRGTSLRFIPTRVHSHGNEKEHSTAAHRHATVVAEQSAIRNQNGLRHLKTVVERQKVLLNASRLFKLIVHDMFRSHQEQLATTRKQRR